MESLFLFNNISLYFHALSVYARLLDWQSDLLDNFTSCDCASYIAVTDYCRQSCQFVQASNDGRSSASGLINLKGGYHLTPTLYFDHWFQPYRLAVELIGLPAANLQLKLSIVYRLPGRMPTDSSSIALSVRCLAMTMV